MDDQTYAAAAEAAMPGMFRMAYSILENRHDAEDAVQQALLNAWQHREKARPGAERAWMMRIVINAIALESVGELTRVAEALALEADIVQLTVARARKLGRYHLMNGMNPIWIAGLHRREGGTEHED